MAVYDTAHGYHLTVERRGPSAELSVCDYSGNPLVTVCISDVEAMDLALRLYDAGFADSVYDEGYREGWDDAVAECDDNF